MDYGDIHYGVMKRKLIIIGNQGSIYENNYLPGVKKDVDNYLNFFGSANGGAWDDNEIVNRKFGWRVSLLRNLAMTLRMDGLDYVLVVFTGHGYAERNGDPYFELSSGEEISLSSLLNLFPYQKMLLIADSCQGYLSEELHKSLNEVLAFAHGGSYHSRAEMKERYNRLILNMNNRQKVMAAAASPGEYARDSSKGGYYSRSLLSAAEYLKNRSSRPAVYTIEQVHSIAASEVSRETRSRQNPKLYPENIIDYPPFLVV